MRRMSAREKSLRQRVVAITAGSQDADLKQHQDVQVNHSESHIPALRSP
jgi:hypothetical protein